MTVLEGPIQTLHRMQSRELAGSVNSVRGLSVVVNDLPLPIGSLVRLVSPQQRLGSAGSDDEVVRGEIVGFDAGRSIVMLLNASAGIAPGTKVIGEQSAQSVGVGPCLLGRIIDGLGRPLDGGPRLMQAVDYPLQTLPTSALQRRRIDAPLPTGVRCLDAMVTLGRGQRIGIFAGPGVGKSTLLGTIARNTSADVNVIALIGERGREVRDFVEHALGPEGLKRSVLVVATGDQSPLLRVRAAFVACAIAEYFRDQHADVLLMMDSITRFAQAQRQIGLTVGEQPATKGYTPSVFALLPVLLERAGHFQTGGSITGLYAVLVEGDDHNEPISDAAKGILDGHITLSRKVASRGHYPAISVLESISRVANDVCDQHHRAARQSLIRLLAAHAEAEELINIGAYARGSNAVTDVAIEMKPAIDAFLQQSTHDRAPYPQTCKALLDLAATANALLTQRAAKPHSPSAAATPGRRA